MKKELKKSGKIACVLGTFGISALGLTGCNEELKNAQTNLNEIVLNKLNTDENSKNNIGGDFATYSFLGSDVEKYNDSKYLVGINGISYSEASNRQALTTLNYVVDNSYFSEVGRSDYKVVSALAEIVKNEKSNSITVNKVNDINALNNALLICNKATYTDNFLYRVKNLEIGEDLASFNAESVAKYFYQTVLPAGKSVVVCANYAHDYIDEKVMVKLTKEDAKRAKLDESYVFDKFSEYVNAKQVDNYAVKKESCKNYKDMAAFNFDYEKCIEK